jgi:hypothetical protein
MEQTTRAERRSIRIYSDFEHPHQTQETDTFGEDSDTGLEELGLGEQTDELRFARNTQYFADNLESFTLSSRDELVSNKGQIQMVLNPTISNFSSFCLHPSLYTWIQPVSNLSEMASILRTDPSWEEIYSTVVASNCFVLATLHTFQSSGDDERSMQAQLVSLVQVISLALGVYLIPRSDKAISIGGMLIREEFDICGVTGPHFENSDRRPVLCTEVKTDRSFPPGSYWHREHRAAQILASMYSHSCIATLVTQSQFKFFFESDERDAVFTFPAHQDPAASQFWNASAMREMGSDFVKAICICLLSPRARCDQEPKLSDVAAQCATKTPKIIEKALKSPENSAERPLRNSGDKKSDQQKASAAGKARFPKFLSGYHDGRPVYTKIRVASDEAAHAIWQLKRQQDAATARSGVVVPVHGRPPAPQSPPALCVLQARGLRECRP